MLATYLSSWIARCQGATPVLPLTRPCRADQARDLLLSDIELSILVGLACALFYAIVRLPMSRFPDTDNHKLILPFGIARPASF